MNMNLMTFSRRVFYLGLMTCGVAGLATSHAQTFALARYQSNGAPDTTFGASGKITTKFKDPGTQADLAAELQDIALVPQTANAIAVGKAGEFAAVASYTGTGALNPAFNNGTGTRLFHMMTPLMFASIGPNSTSIAHAVALKNGKIVVAGSFQGRVCNIFNDCYTVSKRFAVTRFNADGTFDQTFGSGGRVTTSFEDYAIPCPESEAYAVTIDAYDRIVVSGTAQCPGKNIFALARYDSNGNPDLTFGVNGRVSQNLVTESWDYVMQQIRNLSTDAAGNIIATGSLHTFSSWLGWTVGNSSFVVFRLLPWGPFDLSFKQNGVRHVATFNGWNFPQNIGNAVSVLADGRIVAAGRSWFAPQGGTSHPAFTVARLHSNGAMDNSFTLDGVVHSVFPADSEALDVAVTGDKVLAVGRAGDGIAMARYSSNGSPDPTFGSNGKLLTSSSCVGQEAANAIAVPDIRGASWFLIGGTAQGSLSNLCITIPPAN